MDRWKTEVERIREEKRRKKKMREEKESEEDAGAWKGRKVAKHCVFPMTCGSRGSKSGLAKAAGAEPSGQMRDEKFHAVVARSAFPSQKYWKLTVSEHFWKLRWLKWHGAHFEVNMYKRAQIWSIFGSWDVQSWHMLARSRGAKHVSKSKVLKSDGFGALWSWDVENVHGAVARSPFWSQNVKSTPRSGHFWTLNCTTPHHTTPTPTITRTRTRTATTTTTTTSTPAATAAATTTATTTAAATATATSSTTTFCY